MKLLKQFLVILVSIVVLILVSALFVRTEYVVERKISIQQNREDVYNYLKFIKNQDHWSVGQQLDPAMKKYYKGEDGTLGFIYTWSSTNKKVGAGEQEITLLNYPERIETALLFKEPYETNNTGYFQLDQKDKSTIVTWGISGRTPWPLNLYQAFVDMDKKLGPDLEKGLANLKKEIEGTQKIQ